jgi:hypothetical protein
MLNPFYSMGIPPMATRGVSRVLFQLKATSISKAKSSPEMNNVFFIANYQEYVILYNPLKYIDFS